MAPFNSTLPLEHHPPSTSTCITPTPTPTPTSSPTPSSPPSTNTTTTTPTVCALCSMELDKEPPPTLLSSISSRKDQRAHDHERQRTRRATERRDKRAPSALVAAATAGAGAGTGVGVAMGGTGKCSCWRLEKGGRRRRDVRGLSLNLWEGAVDDVVVDPRSPTSPAAAKTRSPGASPVRGSLRVSRRASGQEREVRLADLVVAAKPRKSRSKAGDFEVIPHVKSVIVLDDMMNDDLEIDEPWEHVSGVDSDEDKKENAKTKGRSYADVASFAR